MRLSARYLLDIAGSEWAKVEDKALSLTFNPRLHGLRGLAALAVLVFHWADFYAMYDYLEALGQEYTGLIVVDYMVRFGWLGVPLFFVLSGYLLSDILFKKQVPLGYFFRRRVLRIYPAVWAQLLLLIALAGFIPGWKHIDLSLNTLANVFLYINLPPINARPINGVWWTLPVELSFYLILPFLVLLCRSIPVWGLFLFSIALSVGWRGGLIGWLDADSYLAHIPKLDALPGMLVYFCAGMVIAKTSFMPGSIYRLGGLLGAVLCMALILVFFRSVMDTYWTGHWFLACSPAILAPCIAAMVWLLSQGVSGFRWLGARPLVWLGEISYGVYLWHFPVLWALATFSSADMGVGHKMMWLTLCMLITFALAYGSYVLIERPLMKWRRSLPQR